MISKKIKIKDRLSNKKHLDVNNLIKGILSGDRGALARGITLVESRLDTDRVVALELLAGLGKTENIAKSIAITGPPGAGKSSFIESIGLRAINDGFKVAVLSIDPSSELTQGSILGDKTRMPLLSSQQMAFVRPSPTSGDLGGVNRRTFEVKRLCEAAGFDVIFIETVGVGQSESEVRQLVDMTTVLLQPGSGDDLQGIKKGLNELADFFVVNKADGSQLQLAREAKSFILTSTKLGRADMNANHIVLSSHFDDQLLENCYVKLFDRHQELLSKGEIEKRRSEQLEYWFYKKSEWALLEWVKSSSVFGEKSLEYLKDIKNNKQSLDEAMVLFVEEIKKSLIK